MSTAVRFSAGMHVTAAAARLCEVAATEGTAHGVFNGIRLDADRDSTADQIVATFDRLTAEQSKAWRESPAGVAAAERDNADRAEKQALHTALMDKLPTLDWSDRVAILDWLCAMQPATDRIGVIIRKDTIAAAFAKHGYTPGMDCGPNYQAGVKNSEFRYLVGQALDGIVNGPAIHPILHKFVSEWKARWAREVAS